MICKKKLRKVGKSMNANELADDIENGMFTDTNYNKKKAANFVRQQQAEIETLKARIEFMVENASHHEGIAHAGGFEQGHEIGRQLGMKQERALWELAASTQEIEKWSEHQ